MMRRYAMYRRQMGAHPDGDYVLYSDAHALEVRVAELENHVRTLCECIETDPDCKDDYTYQVRDARKALAQTEGV